MEQGPARTRRRESRRLRMAEISVRALKTVAVEASVAGRSSSRNTGGRTTFVHWMRRSSILGGMAFFLDGGRPISPPLWRSNRLAVDWDRCTVHFIGSDWGERDLGRYRRLVQRARELRAPGVG